MNLLYKMQGLEKYYSNKIAMALPYFEINKGQIIALTGANGAGKSTLLRLLAFLEKPDCGTIDFWGTINIAPRHEVTLLLQEPYLLKRTVCKNLEYGLHVRGDMNNSTERVKTALAYVGFAPEKVMYRQWYELSGGEKQRVALAARLILNPLVLLLDEPTASVDMQSAILIYKAVNMIVQQGTTVIIASHDREWLKNLDAIPLVLNSMGEIYV